ncbi:MAG: DegV family protein [Lachnospiraceae bacterium]|nr:DegV family protein [Lachnospiraceae bacterium]
MAKVVIIADSTCDLTDELIRKNNITILPLCVILDDKSYFDKEEITVKDIFEWADNNKTTPKTQAVPMDRIEKVLKPLMEDGVDTIFFGISEQMSATCNSVRLVGESLGYDRLFVINSESLSSGIGLQILRACKLRDEGKTAEEIVNEIEAKRNSVRASFIINTLTYLARGGRCTSVTAFLASALKIKPVIEVKEGAMGVAKKMRGDYKKAVMKYVTEMESDLLSAEPTNVFITYPTCDQDIVDEVYNYLAGLKHFENIYKSNAGGVIASHCGPGTIGVLFYAD